LTLCFALAYLPSLPSPARSIRRCPARWPGGTRAPPAPDRAGPGGAAEVELAVDEFEKAHEIDDHFSVLPGHVMPVREGRGGARAVLGRGEVHARRGRTAGRDRSEDTVEPGSRAAPCTRRCRSSAHTCNTASGNRAPLFSPPRLGAARWVSRGRRGRPWRVRVFAVRPSS
jgi:hypothetical protein